MPITHNYTIWQERKKYNMTAGSATCYAIKLYSNTYTPTRDSLTTNFTEMVTSGGYTAGGIILPFSATALVKGSGVSSLTLTTLYTMASTNALWTFTVAGISPKGWYLTCSCNVGSGNQEVVMMAEAADFVSQGYNDTYAVPITIQA